MMNGKKLELSPSQNMPYVGPETPRSLIHRFANAYPDLWKKSDFNAVEFLQRNVIKVVLRASYSSIVVWDVGLMDDSDRAICEALENIILLTSSTPADDAV